MTSDAPKPCGPPAPGGLLRLACRQFKDGAWRDFADTVTPEAPVVLHWPGRDPVRLWAFAEDLDALALGHALLELCRPGQRPRLVQRKGDEFLLAPDTAPAPAPAPGPLPLEPAQVLDAMAGFIQAGGRWDDTGCFHRAAVFDPGARRFVHHVEDIGRHNCIDRLAGWALESGEPLPGRLLFVSARATASLAAKAARAGFGAMVSRSAVTTAGIAAAAGAGLSLAGFARAARFTVFTDPAGVFLGAQCGPGAG
ncbi:formate dehydrogenase accessory sulfurtransferase FdhD [Desulfocurvus vexinensis]|uniref:formate dehydrogenase accessory sulfurtransferase FdhD n=1 Tax=Desulfocurvus vexinensis TaxID=399548 RepID=UPI0004BB7FD8|nr:formate dehydrogenase accessory sulfurtransferase FdhD [Desulfocurvus vexinensis]